MTGEQTLITGMWKFSDKYSKEDLAKYAEEILSKDENYEQLYVRKCSKDQHGIGVAYRYDGSKEGFDKYTEETKDKLYKEFGTGLVGWDFGSHTITIKGF